MIDRIGSDASLLRVRECEAFAENLQTEGIVQGSLVEIVLTDSALAYTRVGCRFHTLQIEYPKPFAKGDTKIAGYYAGVYQIRSGECPDGDFGVGIGIVSINNSGGQRPGRVVDPRAIYSYKKIE